MGISITPKKRNGDWTALEHCANGFFGILNLNSTCLPRRLNRAVGVLVCTEYGVYNPHCKAYLVYRDPLSCRLSVRPLTSHRHQHVLCLRHELCKEMFAVQPSPTEYVSSHDLPSTLVRLSAIKCPIAALSRIAIWHTKEAVRSQCGTTPRTIILLFLAPR